MSPAKKHLRLGALVYLAVLVMPGLLCNASSGDDVETMQKYANESLVKSESEADVDAPIWSQFLEDYVLRWV